MAEHLTKPLTALELAERCGARVEPVAGLAGGATAMTFASSA